MMKKESLLTDMHAVIQCFESVSKALDAMFDVFEEEYLAASTHQITKMEAIVAKKNTNFDLFAKNLLDLFKLVNKVSQEFNFERIQTISQIKDTFLEIKNIYKNDTLFYSEISKLNDQISHLASHVLKNSAATQERVKKNQLIVNRLLGFHRESFQFWQKMLLERTKSYDEKGHMRPSQMNQLSVKA